MMEIETVIEKVRVGDYEISLHAEKERYAEDISLDDIETAIFSGEIIEDYPQRIPEAKAAWFWGIHEGGQFILFVVLQR